MIEKTFVRNSKFGKLSLPGEPFRSLSWRVTIVIAALGVSMLLGRGMVTTPASSFGFLIAGVVGCAIVLRAKSALWICLLVYVVDGLLLAFSLPRGIKIGSSQIFFREILLVFVVLTALVRLVISERIDTGLLGLKIPDLHAGARFVGITLILFVMLATLNTAIAGTNGFGLGIRILLPPFAVVLMMSSFSEFAELRRAFRWLYHFAIVFLVVYMALGYIGFEIPVEHPVGIAVFGAMLSLGRAYEYSSQTRWKQLRHCILLLCLLHYFTLGPRRGTGVAITQFVFSIWLFLFLREMVLGRKLYARLFALAGLVAGIVVLAGVLSLVVPYARGRVSVGTAHSWIVAPLEALGETKKNLLDRWDIWKPQIDLIRDRPFRLYFVDLPQYTYKNPYGHEYPVNSHNVFLALAVYLTVLAPFMVIFLVVRFMKLGVRAARQLPEDMRWRVLAMTCFVPGLFAADIWGLNITRYINSLLMWLSVSLVAALYVTHISETPGSKDILQE